MFKSLGARIGLIFASYLMLLCAVVGATAFVLHRQSDDAVVVNLSGRQRMLTQRITHQLLGYAALAEHGADTQTQRAAVISSMQIFEKTLHALEKGGPAPLDLQMVNMRNTPAASSSVGAQLRRVRNLYDKYRVNARKILDGAEAERAKGVSYIIDHNTELLSEMNTGVNMMQAEAEARVQLLYYVQGGAILLGLVMSWLLSALTRRTIVQPLRELNQVSDAMSRGEVHRRISAQGPQEIHELGSSFERLRVSMKNLLSTPADHSGFSAL